MTDIRYIIEFNTFLVRKRDDSQKRSHAEQKLLGARLHVDLNDVEDGLIAARDIHDHSGFVPVSSTQH